MVEWTPPSGEATWAWCSWPGGAGVDEPLAVEGVGESYVWPWSHAMRAINEPRQLSRDEAVQYLVEILKTPIGEVSPAGAVLRREEMLAAATCFEHLTLDVGIHL